MAPLRGAAQQQPQDGAGLGAEGASDVLVGLQVRSLGPKAIRLVVSLGDAQPAETDDRKSEDAQVSVAEHPHLPQARRHERCQREPERQDPMVKYTARGFRNFQNFVNAIYFHCGGLNLSPAPT